MTEATSFLYPFIDAEESDPDTLLVDLAASARSKAAESAALQARSLEQWGDAIEAAGIAMAQRIRDGGRVFTFGNGGSSTDAATLAALFARPTRGRPIAAWTLAADQAVMTALGNDIGFEVIFSRQLIARARAGDIAIALSTSGNSADLVMAVAQARKQGMLVLAFSGYAGGRLAETADVDHCFTIDSQSIHRIQESQARIGHRLWQVVQRELGTAADTPGELLAQAGSRHTHPTGTTTEGER